MQWKEAGDGWDTPEDVFEATTTGTTLTITGLTGGTDYAVRVIAVNAVGPGAPSEEATGTPRETTPPELSTATVNGATLTLTYDETLDGNSVPAANAFSVSVGGAGYRRRRNPHPELGGGVRAGGDRQLHRACGRWSSPHQRRRRQRRRVLQRAGGGQ